RVLDGDDVARMKAELRLKDAERLGAEPLARIRRDLDADLVLLGSYAALNDQVRIDLRVQESVRGETVAAASQSGSPSALFELVARLGAELRARLDAESASEADLRAMRAAMPSSIDAARAYAEG